MQKLPLENFNWQKVLTYFGEGIDGMEEESMDSKTCENEKVLHKEKVLHRV